MHLYLLGSLILLLAWGIIFVLKKNLRKEMIIGSIMVTPTALTEILYVPSYWKPDSIISPKLSIEDFIFCWSIGGIIVVCYELLMRGTLRHRRLHQSLKEETFHIFIILMGIAVLFISYILFRINFAYSVYIALIFLTGVILALRPDLIKKALYSGVIFGSAYAFFFIILLRIFPNLISLWNAKTLIGIYFLGMPIEEIVWAFLAGIFIAPLYEFLLSFELIKVKRYRLGRSRK